MSSPQRTDSSKMVESTTSSSSTTHTYQHQVSAVEVAEEHRQKVTFYVGGHEAMLSASAPVHDPSTPLSPAIMDNVFEEHSSATSASEVQVLTQSSSKSMYSYAMHTETKQTSVTGPVTTPVVCASQGARTDKQGPQDTGMVAAKSPEVVKAKDKQLHSESEKGSECVNSSVVAKHPKTMGTISGPESSKLEGSSTAVVHQQKASSPDTIMQTFEERERLFRDLFLTPAIVDMSQEQEGSLVPAIEDSVMDTSTIEETSSPVHKQIVGLDHLDNLVKLMEQLAWLKEENSKLKRKVLYLEDTKSLLQVRAQMLETRVHHSMESMHQHSHHQSAAGSFIQHQHSRAKSLISKQQAKIMHYLSAGGTSVQQHVPPKPPLEKCPSDNTDIVNRQKLSPQSSKEPMSPSDSPPSVSQAQTPTSQQKVYSRSQSVGSIEMVDLDLETTVMELDTVKPLGQRQSPSKSLMFRRSDFKASKKLQEKWERVKKVFGSKPEAEFEGSVTAEEILKVNSKSQRLHKQRPPSLTHMASLDASQMPMDRLKPDDKVISRSNPQLNDQPPHTPSSTHSEPPATVTSRHTSEEDEEEEESTAFTFDTSKPAHSYTTDTAPVFTPSTAKQAGTSSEEPMFSKSRLSSTSSSDSSGSSEVEQAFALNTAKKDLDTLSPEEDVNYLSVSRIMKRRRSSPTLSTQDAEMGGKDREAKSPRMGRSASFKVTRNRSPQPDQHTMTSSTSVPTTPVSSDTDQRKPSPFRAASSDAHKKAKMAWGRVKNIIHNKKDSLKLRKSKSSEDKDSDVEPSSPNQTLSSNEELKAHTLPATATFTAMTTASPVAMTTPTTSTMTTNTTSTSSTTTTAAEKSSSPTLLRRLTQKAHRGPSPRRLSPDNRSKTMTKPSSPDLAPSPHKRESIAQAMAAGSPVDVIALLGINEEYQRKMQDWEEKKKRGLTKANSFADGDGGLDPGGLKSPTSPLSPHTSKKYSEDVKYSEDFIKKMEEWEQMKGLLASPLLPQGSPAETVYPTSVTPRDQSPTAPGDPAASGEVTQQQLSESFSKRVQEWERVKTKRYRDPASSTSPDGRSRKQKRATVHLTGRSKSLERSRERSRSSSKYDRELIMKIEKKEQKLKREMIKLDKMKQKLDGMGIEQDSGGSEGKSEHVLSQDFMRKLREWEEMKGLSPSHLEVASLDPGSPHHLRAGSHREDSKRSISRDRMHSDSAITPLRPAPEGAITPGSSPSSTPSPGGVIVQQQEKDKPGDRKVAGSEDMEALLNDKNEEIALLQDDISQMTERINLINKEHSQEIATYRRELWASSKVGRFTIESDLMSASLRELDLQINYLQDYSQRLAKEKRQLHMRVQEETRNRREIEAHLLEDLKQVQNTLLGQSLDTTGSPGGVGSVKDIMSHLYSYLAHSQLQLNELRADVSERGRLLEEMERHLLVQEVTNKLLLADLQRRELEVRYLKDARKRAVIKRWKTYGGTDYVERRKSQDQRPTLKRNNSSVLRQSMKRQSSCELLCRQIRQMKHSEAMTDQAFSTPTDWLQQIHAQVQHYQSLPPVQAIQTTTATVQTVMTLCNCPYLPQTPPQSPKQSVTMATNTMDITVAMDTKEIQTSIEDLTAKPADSSPKAGLGQMKVKKELFPEAASKERQYSLPSDSIPRDQIDRLIQQYRKQDGAGSTLSTKAELTPESKSPSLGRRPKSGSLYSEWLKREYKPPKIEHRKVLADKDKEQDSVFESKAAPTSAAPASVTDDRGVTEVVAMEVTQELNTQPSDKGVTAQPQQPQQLTAESEVEAKPPQMPRSPIIRSKYPRRFKTTEVRTQNLYDAQSQAVWKATPLRRALRHRKGSAEKSPDSSMEVVCSPPEDSSIRERTKSDSSIMHPPPTSLHTPVSTESTGSLATKQYLSVDDKNKGVMDIVSRYEKIQQIGSPKSSSLQSSPSLTRALHCRSPGPMAVSPVRRLKTAEELLQDIGSAKTTKDDKALTPRDQLPSSSSDKENDKGRPNSKVLAMIERFSAEGESEPEQESVRSRSGSMEQRQAPTGTESPKPPLKDRTNEGQQQQQLSPQGARTRTNIQSPTSPIGLIRRKSPKSASRAKSLSAAEAMEVMRERSRTNPDSIQPLEAQETALTAPTTPTSSSPLNMRSGTLLGKQPVLSNGGSEDSVSSPWQLQERRSPKAHKKRRVTPLTKPSSPGKSSKGKGAISTLCMQAMNISVETSASGSEETVAPPSSPGGSPRHEKKEAKSKNKFMDSYRKLFKVSKC